MGSKSCICKNFKDRRLKIHVCSLWITWYLTLVKTSPSSFSTTPPPPLQICTNMFILCRHFSGGKCLRSAVLFYFYYVSWIYSVCLLYFSYSHYLWVLFFVSCSGRVFWALYLISRFTIHSVLRSATIFVTFSTTISLWK